MTGHEALQVLKQQLGERKSKTGSEITQTVILKKVSLGGSLPNGNPIRIGLRTTLVLSEKILKAFKWVHYSFMHALSFDF